MPAFDFSRLRRRPDVEAPNLQAWDATDELLVQHALDAAVPGEEIAVIGDDYGAVTLALAAAGLRGIRVHQDLVTGREALRRNAEGLAIDGFRAHELDEALLTGAKLVLVQLPKSLAELEEIVGAVARWASPEVVLVAGGRVKHMTLAQNEVIGSYFGTVQPQRAARKSRLLLATDRLADVPASPYPLREEHRLWGERTLVLCAHGGTFAGARLDIGTRVLLDALPTLAPPAPAPASPGQQFRKNVPESGENPDSGASEARISRVVDAPPLRVTDLGCGNGALAAAFAMLHPEASVTATDRSASAVASARATAAANGLSDRIEVTLDDAGSALAAGSADLVLLNPPFHLGASVHEGAGRRLIEAAARLVRPGGEVWTVFNSHLDHRRALARAVGSTEQVVRTPKFTVTRSIRRT